MQHSEDHSELRQFKVPPRQSFSQKGQKLLRDYWVIASLIVGIISVAMYGVLSAPGTATSSSTTIVPSPTLKPSTNSIAAIGSNKNSEAESNSADEQYWMQGFENGGHFTNFTQVIMDELSRDFEDVQPERFELNVNREILDKANWKELFNVTEHVVKAMKLISLQDDVLRSKKDSFGLAEDDFTHCSDSLLENNKMLDSDSDELLEANRTIAKEEGILDNLRSNLSDYQAKKKQQLNTTQILINSKLLEKQQQAEIFGQTVDKSQLLKDLLGQQIQVNQSIEELRGQILLTQAEKVNLEEKQEQNIQLASTLREELNTISFDIQKLELNIEMDDIVGRVKREDHINNTKELTSLIQKRIKLIQTRQIHSTDGVSADVLQQFESDKSSLAELNNLQINLIRSFRSQSQSQGGKTLEQLRQEQLLKESQLHEVEIELEGKDLKMGILDGLIAGTEVKIGEKMEELEEIARKIKELESYFDADGEIKTDQLKIKLKKLEEELSLLKKTRSDQENEYQAKVGEFLGEIQAQKDTIKAVQSQFSKQISKRQSLEKTVLTDLNKCRSYRYMMSTIQQSAEECQFKVAFAQESLIEMKLSLFSVLDKMIPDEE